MTRCQIKAEIARQELLVEARWAAMLDAEAAFAEGRMSGGEVSAKIDAHRESRREAARHGYLLQNGARGRVCRHTTALIPANID